MIERFGYRRAVTAGVIVATGVAALFGCTASESGTKATNGSECIAVGFGSDKGGPGLIGVNVYPILRDDAVATEVSGKVISGNDKGAIIKDNSAVFAGSGEFLFSWDGTTQTIQTSKVAVAAEIAGRAQLQECPETTLRFDPTTYSLSPTYK